MTSFESPKSPPDPSSEHQRELLANLDKGFAVCEMLFDPDGKPRDYRFLDANPQFEVQTGLRLADILGKTILELFPDIERTWIEKFGHITSTGHAERFEDYNHNTQRHYEIFAYSTHKPNFCLLVRDITARKQSEQSLRDSEARLRLALEVGKLALWNSNYVTGEYMWDDALTHLLGYPPGTPANREGWARRVHPEDLPRVRAILAESVRLGGDFHAEYRIFSQNDETRWVEARGHIQSDPNGNVVSSYGVLREITEYRRTAEELRLTTERFQLALRGSPVVVFCQDLDLRYTWIENPALDYDSSAFVGKRDTELFDRPQDAVVTEQIKREVIRSGKSQRQVVTVQSRGVDRFYDLLVDPRLDHDSKIIGVRCAAIDITERKHGEMQLQEAAERLHLALEASHSGTFDWEITTGLSKWSPELERVYGLTPGSFDGSLDRWRKWVHPDDLATMEASIAEAIATGELRGEWRIIREDTGEIRWLNGRGKVFYDSSGIPVHLVGINVDITESKRAQQALLSKEKLNSAGRMATSISHEINNPLEAVVNLLYLAKSQEQLPPTARDYLDLAETQLHRIAHFTRQSLGFYRESGGTAPTQLNALLDSTIELLKGKIDNKNASVSRIWRTEIDIVTIPGELRQIFSNILSNSIEAIDSGGSIVIKISRSRNPKNATRRVRVSIADNGKGIPPNALPHIFEPFFTTRDGVGTGLGLWVCHQLVEKHKGSIQIRTSTYGPHRGTIFSVTLPL
jgi:PAS domain S-box-containing protein